MLLALIKKFRKVSTVNHVNSGESEVVFDASPVLKRFVVGMIMIELYQSTDVSSGR